MIAALKRKRKSAKPRSCEQGTIRTKPKEKRLPRVLLMLAHLGKEGVPETVVPKISQETLADMVGSTRS